MTRRGGHNAPKRRFLLASDGSITIEFVVTFPLILAALAFSFEFGRLIIAHHTTVNNVRSAVRFLSRAELTEARIDQAEEIVKTGRPSGGTAPDWMADATVTVTPDQSTFSDDEFRVGGQVVRIEADVSFPLLIFSFIGSDRATIPMTIVEDIRYVGD